MDFYEKKIRALKRIDELVTNQEEIEKIYYKIETEFGFGKKFVDNRIQRLKQIVSKNSN
jgi:hypothetical protein